MTSRMEGPVEGGLPVVPRDAVAASPLRGRLVLSPGDPADWPEQPPDTAARLGSSGVFVEGAPRLLGNRLHSDERTGTGVLSSTGEFMTAVRVLLDELLDPGREGWVVEHVPAGTPLEVATAAYPDAQVAGTARELDAVLRTPAPTGGRGHDPGPQPPERLLLVVGAPRSGTTWLEQMLLAHPGAGGIAEAETWIFRGVSGFWENHRGAGGLGALVDTGTLADALRRFTGRLFGSALATQPGARCFVEKTPGHVFSLRDIHATWTDAHIVSLVRDGRDVARSAAEIGFGSHDIEEAARVWASSVEAAWRASGEIPRLREVRYESLVADPVGRTLDVLEWAGLSCDGAVAAAVREVAGRRVSQYDTTGDVGRGKWRTLAPEDLRIVLATAGETLVSSGYVDRTEVDAARRELRRPRGWLAERRRRLRARPPRPGAVSRGRP